MKIVNLVVVAHPDDEILGFGATGAKLVSQLDIVKPIILCGDVDARTNRLSDGELFEDIVAANKEVGFSEPVIGKFPNLKMNAVDHLDVVRFIEEQIHEYRPTRVFTHHPADLNDDHVQVSKACMAAARIFQRNSSVQPIESLYFMEILSASDWAFPGGTSLFTPTLFVDIDGFLERKIEALSCYRRVMRDFPHPRSIEVLRGLAAYRGGQSGQRYSEAFQTVFQREL